MGNQSNAAVEVYPERGQKENYGLRAGVLGPLETLAQSVSAMAPSTSPSLTIPLVFAIAGNATWLVYLLAMGATLLVGFCVSRFARLSASPGSLYTYTAEYPAAGFWRGGRLGAIACISCYCSLGCRRCALLHQCAFAAIPSLDSADSRYACRRLRRCGTGCLSRCKTLGRTDALDRDLLDKLDLHHPHGHAGPLRVPSRHGPIQAAWSFIFRSRPSTGAFHVQLCRL